MSFSFTTQEWLRAKSLVSRDVEEWRAGGKRRATMNSLRAGWERKPTFLTPSNEQEPFCSGD